ncbi:TonB-dependent receptor [Halomonas sp. Bachu 37]|uniref:TonB-dependent receptor domain-containing protein n=1 Tax=Halomonas kashgarensis TaxID=3084920 RepID=UPI003216DB92
MKNLSLASCGLAAFSLTALATAVHAQTPNDETLNPLVVTAALAPVTAEQSLSSVTVIDEDALRRQNPDAITDVLRAQPGVDVTTQGSYGKQSSVFLRGTGSAANVMMIDGIRLRSATSGAASWEFLDPELFERVEIVRGPRGSLYGADAVGGVVQLFTQTADEGGPHPSVSVGGGSFDTQRYSATFSGSEGGTRYSFAGSHFTTGGIEVREGEGDKGFDNTTGLVKLSHTFDNDLTLGLLGLRARGNTEYHQSGPADEDFTQQVLGVYAEAPLGSNWSTRLSLSEARDERDSQALSGRAIFDTRTHTARWENTLSMGAHRFIAGAEYSEDRVTGTTRFDESHRDNAAVFTQALLDFSPLISQASLRYDDNEAFGEEVTGSLALGYELDSHHTLRASYGTAFRAPTFNDLYYPGYSNPDLKAETSGTFELGVRGNYGNYFWDLAAYQTDLDDLIGLDQNYLPENVDRARIRGAELSAGAELDDWTLQAALTYTDPEDRDSGNRLVRRAKQSLRLDVDREIADWTVGASLIALGDRYNDAVNEEHLGGFGLLNLRAGWAFAPYWSARVTVDNVLDKDYVTARGSDFDPVTFESSPFDYQNAGRSVFLTLRYGAQ